MRGEFMPQGNIIGGIHNKIHRLHRGQSVVKLRHPGQSKILVGVDEFGNTSYRCLRGHKFDASSLYRLHRNTVNLSEKAGERNAYSTEKRKRTVISGVAAKRNTFRPRKVKGFMFPATSREIAKDKKENALKRRLKEAGIDEHKLFLLIHSAYHSQTNFEKELPRRPLPSWKKSGMSPYEIKEMKKQRLKNQRVLARSGNIYHH